MNGIINLLKPPCLPSAQAVSFVKRLVGAKVGHAGTLDPEACGVLPVMVGKATRLFDYLNDEGKRYVAEIAFGMATDTQDATGQVTERGDIPSPQAVQAVLREFTGDILQAPPAFSALKREGQTLYKLARQGIRVETQPRPVRVDQLELLRQTAANRYTLRIVCSKGTYIRTLCHDIGQALQCPAHMRLLIRERSGPFEIGRAISMEGFERALAEGVEEGAWLVGMEEALSHLTGIRAPASLMKRCINGVALELDRLPGASALAESAPALLHCDGRLIGIYMREGELLKVRTMLFGQD